MKENKPYQKVKAELIDLSYPMNLLIRASGGSVQDGADEGDSDTFDSSWI